MPQEIEHASKNLYFNSAGQWVEVTAWLGAGVACIIGAVALGAWIMSLKRHLHRWLLAPLVPLVIFGPLFWMGSAGLFGEGGKVEQMILEDVDGERLITATFVRHGKQTTTSTKVFKVTGEVLGRESRRGSGPQVLGEVGGAVIVRDGESVRALDRRTRAPVFDLLEVLDRAYGAKQYQIKAFKDAGVEVLRKDGRTELFDLRAALPAALRDVQPTRRVNLDHADLCGTDPLHYKDGHKEGLRDLAKATALLRPRVVHAPRTSSLARPCGYEVGDVKAALLLHRDTAFGDDGAFSLSAARLDQPSALLWTTDLSPAVGPDALTELQLLDVRRADDGALCLWMLRQQLSLSEVCLDADTGALRSAQVVF
jgi:hypothetical protein